MYVGQWGRIENLAEAEQRKDGDKWNPMEEKKLMTCADVTAEMSIGNLRS